MILFHHRHRHRRQSFLLRAALASATSSKSNKAVLVAAQQSWMMKRLLLLPSSSSSAASSSSLLPGLTRYQKLRLPPKERAIYLRVQTFIRHKNSSSLLEIARSNARFNLQYLKSNANTNLRKNIQTMKRLFNGEEVWKDTSSVAEGSASSSIIKSPTHRRRHHRPKNGSETEDGLNHLTNNMEWERLPSEILSNVRRNATHLSEWMHDATGGKIPAFSRTPPVVGEDGTATAAGGGGSIATRIRNFHIMKQGDGDASSSLVMDKYWIAKNMAFALLPGLLLHLYFSSLQDEMAEYYGKIEQMERERILGIESTKGRMISGGGGGVPPLKNECIRHREDKQETMMGISSALIPEGGTAWDKLKMVVNDLFLGGIEEKMGRRESVAAASSTNEGEAKNAAAHGKPISSSSVLPVNQLAGQEEVPTNHHTALVNNEDVRYDDENDDYDENVTVQMLLQRIRALEVRIASSSEGIQTRQRRRREEEEDEEKHRINRQVERVRQSPIKNRRDNVLEAKWKSEAKNDDSNTTSASSGGNDNDILGVLVGMVNNYEMPSLASYFQSVKESVVGELRKIESLGFPSEKEMSALLPDTSDVDDGESAVAMESDTVSMVGGSAGEGVSSFSTVIDPSVDRHHYGNNHDGNELVDEASRGHWIMNVWQRMRKSSPSCADSEVEDDAHGEEVMPGSSQSTSTK